VGRFVITKGEIHVGLIGQEGRASRESFIPKKLTNFIDACPRCQPVIASLRESKPEQVRLVDLRSEQFIARWMIQF
jgi:hypothetical protein